MEKKQRMDQGAWEAALRRVRLAPPPDLADRIDQARKRILDYKARYPKLAYAHSGGKDSMVLASMAQACDIQHGVWVRTDLEFPAFVTFMRDQVAPIMPYTTVNTGQDLTWLMDHPHMLFPRDSTTSSEWFAQVQHTGQRRYAKAQSLDGLLLGRRWSDGNYCGKGREMEYVDGKGVRRISPLADWSHDHILSYMFLFDLPFAPCYQWPRGFRTGTGPWAKRRCENMNQGWRETAMVDRLVVEEAARAFPSADLWLKANPA